MSDFEENQNKINLCFKNRFIELEQKVEAYRNYQHNCGYTVKLDAKVEALEAREIAKGKRMNTMNIELSELKGQLDSLFHSVRYQRIEGIETLLREFLYALELYFKGNIDQRKIVSDLRTLKKKLEGEKTEGYASPVVKGLVKDGTNSDSRPLSKAEKTIFDEVVRKVEKSKPKPLMVKMDEDTVFDLREPIPTDSKPSQTEKTYQISMTDSDWIYFKGLSYDSIQYKIVRKEDLVKWDRILQFTLCCDDYNLDDLEEIIEEIKKYLSEEGHDE